MGLPAGAPEGGATGVGGDPHVATRQGHLLAVVQPLHLGEALQRVRHSVEPAPAGARHQPLPHQGGQGRERKLPQPPGGARAAHANNLLALHTPCATRRGGQPRAVGHNLNLAASLAWPSGSPAWNSGVGQRPTFGHLPNVGRCPAPGFRISDPEGHARLAA
eukprot:1181507-Prorocentrum_minimum.AAC.1